MDLTKTPAEMLVRNTNSSLFRIMASAFVVTLIELQRRHILKLLIKGVIHIVKVLEEAGQMQSIQTNYMYHPNTNI